MAKIVFQASDRDGNLVEIETSEIKFEDALSGYANFLKFITDAGFTPIKHNEGGHTNGNGKAKPKLTQIDGKTCPSCGSKLYDNRPKKADGSYKATSPDFTCSNQACAGGKDGKKLSLWPGQYELTT